MKKFLVMLVVAVMTVGASACTKKEEAPVETPNAPIETEQPKEEVPAENKDDASASGSDVMANDFITIDKSGDNTIMTMSAELVGTMEGFNADEFKNQDGVLEADFNDAGEFVVTMNKEAYSQFISGVKIGVKDSLDGLIGAEGCEYIKAITYSEDFDKVTVDVVKAGYEADALSAMKPLLISINATMYQQYAGIENKCEVTFVDVDTKEVIESIVYPEAMNQ